MKSINATFLKCLCMSGAHDVILEVDNFKRNEKKRSKIVVVIHQVTRMKMKVLTTKWKKRNKYFKKTNERKLTAISDSIFSGEFHNTSTKVVFWNEGGKMLKRSADSNEKVTHTIEIEDDEKNEARKEEVKTLSTTL